MSKQASDQASPGNQAGLSGSKKVLSLALGIRNLPVRVWRRMNVWQTVLIVALGISLISLGYQAVSFARSNKYQTWVSGNVRDESRDPPLDLQLRLAYPAQVRLEEPGDPGRPISVWLWARQAVTSSVVTFPVTYTVNFEPFDDGLLFTDKDGVPTAPRVEIASGNQPSVPGLVYLHQAPTVREMPGPVTLKASVDSSSRSGISLPDPLFLTVEAESRWSAGVRRFLDLLLGPTTFLLVLAGALLSFGLQQWDRHAKERQDRELHWDKERQEARTKLTKIQSLRTLAVQDISEAVYQWWEYSRKTESDPDWQKRELVVELRDVWQSIESLPWQSALLRKAVRHLENNEQAAAKRTFELIYDLNPDSRSLQAIAARLMAAQLG